MLSTHHKMCVTGGRGRLAALIKNHFRAPVYEVSLFSRSSGHGFSLLDELNEPVVTSAPGTILHLAWSTLPVTSEQFQGSELNDDIPFLERMLASLVASPVHNRLHFIFFSSGGTVYGNARMRPSREEDPCRPIGFYGRAKVEAEKLVLKAASAGLPCTILRISNPYGYSVPSGRPQGIVSHAFRCAMENMPLTIWGDGTAQKDFLYYSDFLTALELVVTRRLCGVYNLCAGESHTINSVLEMVDAQLKHPVLRQYTPSPLWDVHDCRLDNRRLSTAIGWQAQVSLLDGIKRAACDYLRPISK